MLLSVYKRALLVRGFGDGPVPINTLYTEPPALFADPVHAPASGSNLMTTGVNRDTLAVYGWLDLRKGPLVLHVPEMAGRYNSVQFTNPSSNINSAYAGKRTTETQAGDYFISGPGWEGAVPPVVRSVGMHERTLEWHQSSAATSFAPCGASPDHTRGVPKTAGWYHTFWNARRKYDSPGPARPRRGAPYPNVTRPLGSRSCDGQGTDEGRKSRALLVGAFDDRGADEPPTHVPVGPW